MGPAGHQSSLRTLLRETDSGVGAASGEAQISSSFFLGKGEANGLLALSHCCFPAGKTHRQTRGHRLLTESFYFFKYKKLGSKLRIKLSITFATADCGSLSSCSNSGTDYDTKKEMSYLYIILINLTLMNYLLQKLIKMFIKENSIL